MNAHTNGRGPVAADPPPVATVRAVFPPTPPQTSVPGWEPQHSLLVELQAEDGSLRQERIYFRAGLYSHIEADDWLTVEYRKNKWRLAQTQPYELTEVCKARRDAQRYNPQAQPARSPAPPQTWVPAQPQLQAQPQAQQPVRSHPPAPQTQQPAIANEELAEMAVRLNELYGYFSANGMDSATAGKAANACFFQWNARHLARMQMNFRPQGHDDF